MHDIKSILFLLLAAVAFTLKAQQRVDTLQIYEIGEVVVNEDRKQKEARSSTPLQIIDAVKLKQAGAMQVADAVKLFGGAHVKDYGGIGGVKTVSVRSLGAAHTAVAYDGIPITDTQTGQIDLGKLSLDNVSAISLSNGQSDHIFQPARMYAASSVLSITTASPQFLNKKQTIKAGIKAGSFGLVNPSLHLSNSWSKLFSSTILADYLSIDGAYPYINQNGEATEKRKRKNSDVECIKVEATIYGRLSAAQRLDTKLYYYHSERGLPTNILYYTRAGERLWDTNFFAQTTYEYKPTPKWAILANAKFNRSHNRYLNPDLLTDKKENNYRQYEYYASATVLHRFNPYWSLSLANDGSINRMEADLADFALPTRYTWLSALSAKYVRERFTATAHLLATFTQETVRHGTPADNRSRLSPTLSLSFQPLEEEELRVRFFFKEIFRLPTFNDLYYGTVGTRTLKPEKALQFNIGAGWNKTLEKSELLKSFSLNIDAFYNRITDKIVVIPQSLFTMSMMNIGRVEIKGIEAKAEAAFSLTDKVGITIGGNYTLQRALDKTDKYAMPEKMTYNHRIAYTPEHLGTVQAAVETPWVNITYTLMASGERFFNNYNAPEYRMEGYSEQNISFYRTFCTKRSKLNLQVEVLNLLDKQYDIVENYPMPGRQFRASITINY